MLNKEDKAREYHLKRYYGITIPQYNLLRKRQKYLCNVCKRHEKEFPKRLAVDHDHKTGEIRGLICTYCNRYIVGRHQGPLAAELLRMAARHLEKHTGWFVPPRKKRRKHCDK